jgi:hypothetical protein
LRVKNRSRTNFVIMICTNCRLPDSYESLIAEFDLEDELIGDAELEAEINSINQESYGCDRSE